MYDPSLVVQELGMYARRLSSGIFLSGRDPEEILVNSGPPSVVRPDVTYSVDYSNRCVTVTLNGVSRTAQFFGDQGSVILPKDSRRIFFTPVAVTSQLPPADQLEWPMGDAPAANPGVSEMNPDLIREALDFAFDDLRNLVTAVVVVHKGVVVGERYLPLITKDTQLESWSMGKSLLCAVFARLIADGTYELDQPAPIPEWQGSGDPRSKIRIHDLLQMSSGLQFTSGFELNYDFSLGYPDHSLGYADSIDVTEYAVSKPLDPDLKFKGRYRNCDPWVLTRLIKDACRNRGEDYLTYPQRALFDHIGIRRQVIETDPYGNLLFSGCDYGTARNWARFGMLHLQKGMWNNTRILPEGWTDFVSSPAPAWEHAVYGGMFWLNTLGDFEMLPSDTYYAAGAGGNYTFIIPKHDLVIVRMGYTTELTGALVVERPSEPGASMKRMLKKLMEAVPSA